MRLFKSFGGAFLLFFGVFLLYFNLVMALNVVGSGNHITPFLGLFVADNTKWTSDYYFGWDSIWNVLRDMPKILQYDDLLDKFDKFVNTLMPFKDNLLELENAWSFSGSIWEVVKALFSIFQIFFRILISPFEMLVAFIELNVELFMTILDTLTFIKDILNGRYNTPMSGWDSPLVNYFQNTPLPHTSNGVSVPQVASVVVSGGVVTVQ